MIAFQKSKHVKSFIEKIIVQLKKQQEKEEAIKTHNLFALMAAAIASERGWVTALISAQ